MKNKPSSFFTLLFIFIFLNCQILVLASPLKKDEEIILFNTFSHFNENQNIWVFQIHGWIFESEEVTSTIQSNLISSLLTALKKDRTIIKNPLFRNRIKMFLVDNERNKTLSIQLLDHQFNLDESSPDGHFFKAIKINLKQTQRLKNKWISFAIIPPKNDTRIFTGRVQIINPNGYSVISDIDDTIKDSQVSDKTKLLENTFLKPFKSVPKMSEIYGSWEEKQVSFHYVSGSPWQLYPSLIQFFKNENFPKGSLHLRKFRLKDSSILNFLDNPQNFKIDTIESILKKFQKRKFILIGDSTEKDPEIYAFIFQKYSQQIHHIFIRNVSKNSDELARLKATFQNIPENSWTVFTDPEILKKMTF